MPTDSDEDTFNETTNPDMPTKNIQETISFNSGDTLKETIIPQTTTKYVQADLSDSESIVSDNIRKEHSILKNLSKMVELKIKELNQSKSILEFKYNKYKWYHNFWNIGTIFLSSVLTLVESSKLVFVDEINETNDTVNEFLILSPIVLGTTITCCASILKFKKYQESMEEMYIVIDKCISMIARLKNKDDDITLIKNIQKQINICNDCDSCDTLEMDKLIAKFKNEVDEITLSFKKDIINEFSTVYKEIELNINHRDYKKYLKLINDIEYKKHILNKDKESFYENFYHVINSNRVEKMKDDVLERTKSDVNKFGCKVRGS